MFNEYTCAVPVINDKLVQSGTSEDALRTMQLAYKIYHADVTWRETYDIPNPNPYE